MVRQWFSISALLAVAAIMLASDASQARERRFLRRFRGESDYVGSSSYRPIRERRFGTRYPSYYNQTMVTEIPASEMRESNYPPESAMRRSSVFLSVRVPANAELLFDGAKTTQRGNLRQFISPPINPDGLYVYEITAKWMEGGTERTQSRKVDVRAGQRLMVDLTQPLQEKAKR
jgi:uncharacterized protein (TIGR03000 family)